MALALQLFSSHSDDIIVPAAWRPVPGDAIPGTPGHFIGRPFGAGALSMNQIYDVLDSEGRSVGQALKACKQTLAAKRSLAHEWTMYQNIARLGEDFPAARSHFLQAYRVVKHADGTIAAILLAKANGSNVSKTLANPKFCNVRYVTALLRDLLVGLDVAQRVLGFAHFDLKLDNVMEEWSEEDPEAGKARVLIDSVPQFKMFDLGTAVVYPDPFAVHTAVDDHLRAQRPEGAAILAEQRSTSRGAVVDRNSGEPLYEFSQPFCCVRLYHLWGVRKGDVFRVLSGLCRVLDDRTWPLEDLEHVSLLMTVLEHSTNGRRIKARFEPKHLLLRRLYSPQAAAAAAGAEPAAPRHPSTGLSKQLSMALLQQHGQLVLQPSRALTGTVSQLLPSPSSAAAMAASNGGHVHTSKQREEQPLATPQQQGLRVATAQQQQQQLTPQASPALTPTRAVGAPPSPFAQPAVQPGGLGGTGASGSGTNSAGGGGSGTQYTPRRSTEVAREELVTTTSSGRLETGHPRGVSFVRLTKTPSPISLGARGGGDAPDAVGNASGSTPTDQQGSMTATAGAAISSSSASLGKAAASGDATAGTNPAGVLQMVGSGDQRKRQLQAFNTQLLSQHKQQPGSEQRHEVAGSSSAVPAGPRAAATASLAPAAAGRARPHDVVEEEQEFEETAANSDPAADIVAHEPVAVPARQSVLGSRKVLRRVTAMQLLVEPVVQSLLTKV